MKKLLLAAMLLSAAIIPASAQLYKVGELNAPPHFTVLSKDALVQTANKNGDTIKGLINFASSQLSPDSLITYRADRAPFDSGYAFGTNAYGDKGFAERFDFNGKDSGLQVIGTFFIFDGVYSATTTKTVNFKVWAQGPKTSISGHPKSFYDGFPTTVLATSSPVSIRNLGINTTSNNDSAKVVYFGTPTGYLRDSFFVGYDISYTFSSLNGDTIGLKTTRDGYRYVPYSFFQGTDTIRNVKNAAQLSSGTWEDNAWQNFGLGLHYCIFPLLRVGGVGVNTVTKNNLSFSGHVPNPASNTATVHYGLKKGADVTITVCDINGRAINAYNYPQQSVGEHNAVIDVASLPAGNYIYLLRTSDGDGMASQLTVVK